MMDVGPKGHLKCTGSLGFQAKAIVIFILFLFLYNMLQYVRIRYNMFVDPNTDTTFAFTKFHAQSEEVVNRDLPYSLSCPCCPSSMRRQDQ